MTAVSIPPTNRTSAIEALCRFLHSCLPGKPLTVTVEREKAERSSQQNKALFGHAYKVIAQETGLSGRDELEKLHRDFCCRFFGERRVNVLGQVYRFPLRTTTTDENGNRDVIGVVQFSEFYAYVERIAAECGVFVPAPDAMWFRDVEAA